MLKSDIDTALAPGFADWIPESCDTLYVGTGGYNSNAAFRHLNHISEKFELRYDDKNEMIGATWYGCLGVSRAASILSDRVMRWMHIHEFSKYQRDGGDGVDLWPLWHYGVLTMYGGHIAVHHVGKFKISGKAGYLMDSEASSRLELTNKTKHIHCWQNDIDFSKFTLHKGGYKTTDIKPYVSMARNRDYMMALGIFSQQICPEDYNRLFKEPASLIIRISKHQSPGSQTCSKPIYT